VRKSLIAFIMVMIASLFLVATVGVVTADDGKGKPPEPTKTEDPKPTSTEDVKPTDTPEEPKPTSTPEPPKDNDGDGISDKDDADDDNDGVEDKDDNCQFVANADQTDMDDDKVGDACDEDDDGDKLPDEDEKDQGTNPKDEDTDKDGCKDGVEMGEDEKVGGDRDPVNSWDYYDVAGANGGLPDQTVDLANDILGVITHFSPGGGDKYDYAHDRGPAKGASWIDTEPPDGAIDLPNDILGVIQQFSHNCEDA